LFMRRDEIEAAWSWVEPILDAWANSIELPRFYPAGSWVNSAARASVSNQQPPDIGGPRDLRRRVGV